MVDRNLEEKMKQIFAENGLEIFAGEEEAILDIDSLRLISLIVSVEDEFEIEIPDEYLSQAVLGSFADFLKLVSDLINSDSF